MKFLRIPCFLIAFNNSYKVVWIISKILMKEYHCIPLVYLLVSFLFDLQKEKKLKNLLKEGNCMVKMLKRKQEGRSSHDLFFTQIDLKIVSRVLRMSRITSDQLIWCQKKLSKIIFSGKKIHREPSFLLFPC